MAIPPIRATVFYQKNAVSVDSGAGIDVRGLGTTSAAGDATQACQATHTQDGAIRTFDPGTTGVTTSTDVLTVLQTKGWALPLSDVTPADARCQALLPAGSLTFTNTLTVGRSAVPLADTAGVTLRASLWKYNPTTNTGTFIASQSSASTTYELLLNAAVSKNHTMTITWASDVVFAADETLYLQVGCGCGTMGNPLTGTITYTFTLTIDSFGRELTLNTASLLSECGESGSPLCVGTVTRAGRVRDIRSPIGKGATSRSSRIRDSRTSTGVGAPDELSRIRTTRPNLVGVGTASRTARARATRSTTGPGTIARAARVRSPRSLTAIGTINRTRLWRAFRTFSPTGVVTLGFSRSVIFVRQLVIDAIGLLRPRIELDIDDLPVPCGGSENLFVAGKADNSVHCAGTLSGPALQSLNATAVISAVGTLTVDGMEGFAGHEFAWNMNRLAGTTGLDAPGAINAWASTYHLDAAKALNVKASTTSLDAQGAIQSISGSDQDAQGAAGTIPT